VRRPRRTPPGPRRRCGCRPAPAGRRAARGRGVGVSGWQANRTPVVHLSTVSDGRKETVQDAGPGSRSSRGCSASRSPVADVRVVERPVARGGGRRDLPAFALDAARHHVGRPVGAEGGRLHERDVRGVEEAVDALGCARRCPRNRGPCEVEAGRLPPAGSSRNTSEGHIQRQPHERVVRTAVAGGTQPGVEPHQHPGVAEQPHLAPGRRSPPRQGDRVPCLL
jgi:hypothetical protein